MEALMAQIEREKREKAGRVMIRCLNRICNSVYLGGWDRWRQVVIDHMRAGGVMNRCLNKIANAKFVAAWDQWSAVNAMMVRAGQIMQRTMSRITSSLQSAGWMRWLQVRKSEQLVELHASAKVREFEHLEALEATGTAIKDLQEKYKGILSNCEAKHDLTLYKFEAKHKLALKTKSAEHVAFVKTQEEKHQEALDKIEADHELVIEAKAHDHSAFVKAQEEVHRQALESASEAKQAADAEQRALLSKREVEYSVSVKNRVAKLENKASDQQAALQHVIDNMRSTHTMVLSDWEMKLRVAENKAEEQRMDRALLIKDYAWKKEREAESVRLWQERLQDEKAWQRKLTDEWRTKHAKTVDELEQMLRAGEASWEKKIQRQKEEERERLVAVEEKTRQEGQLAVEAAKSELQRKIRNLEAQCLTGAITLEGVVSKHVSALEEARIEHASALQAKEVERQTLLATLEADHKSLAETRMTEHLALVEAQEEDHQDALESVLQVKQAMEANHLKEQAKSRSQLLQRVCFNVSDKFRLRMMYRVWILWTRSAVAARIDDVWASWEKTVRRNVYQRRLAAEKARDLESVRQQELQFNGHGSNFAASSPLPSAGVIARSSVDRGLLTAIRMTIQRTNSASRSMGSCTYSQQGANYEQPREAVAITPPRLPGGDEHHARPSGPPLAAALAFAMPSSYKEVLAYLGPID
jgi:hypothetical protein